MFDEAAEKRNIYRHLTVEFLNGPWTQIYVNHGDDYDTDYDDDGGGDNDGDDDDGVLTTGINRTKLLPLVTGEFLFITPRATASTVTIALISVKSSWSPY